MLSDLCTCAEEVVVEEDDDDNDHNHDHDNDDDNDDNDDDDDDFGCLVTFWFVILGCFFELFGML